VPNPGPQTLLVTCPIWDLLYGGARGGGKTDGLLGDFTGFSMKHPGLARGVLFRRTYDELDEVVQRSQEILGPLGGDWRPSRYTWHMPWGGFLKLRYLKADADAARYQGHSYNWLAIDEAGNFANPDPIKKLTATLRDKNGVPVRKRLTANPGGPGHAWLKRDYIDPAVPGTPFPDPDTGKLRVFIPSKLSDNPALTSNDPEYEQRLRGSGPAWLVRAWLEGDWNAAPEGGIIKMAWFRRYTSVPEPPERYMIVHSWDTAYKAQQVHDPSVCTVWAVATSGFYLLDVIRLRAEYPTLRKRILDLAERDRPHAILVEDKASGQSLLQDLGSSTQLPLRAIEPEGDKVTRALAVTQLMESGRVHLPERAPWLLDYELELSMFPHEDMHDDQVDSTTQFLAWARLHAARRLEAHSSGETRAALAETGYRAQDNRGWGTIGSGSNPSGFV
jgi:predicted phage terminase large subunit-like protein